MPMIFATLSRLARVRLTLSYAAVLVAISTALVILGPRVQQQVILHVSTNLHNLARGKIGTLFGSAFVIDAGPMYVWLPGLVCLLALAELHWRSGRLTIAFLLGHVGATLVVAVGLIAAVEFGWLPAWIGWWLAVGLAGAALGAEFTDAGHGVALVIGMLLATRFGRAGHWTPVRYALLTVGGAFGFLLLAHTAVTATAGLVFGVVSALAADRIARWRLTRRSLEMAAMAVREPVTQS